jgi:putative protease
MTKMQQNIKPELVAPAGNWASLHSAIDAGADAVYFGIKGLNMRKSANNFDILEMQKVMDLLRQNGKKGYLALNVIVYDGETDKVRKILEEAKRARVDAVILWDMAVFSMAKELGLKIHLSTQASVSNFEAFKTYSSMGAKRIVLARECTLNDIRNITRRAVEENIECAVETFIHGAMCVSVSGRCFMSQDSFAKSANRGECLQPCRREFSIIDNDTDAECSYVLGEDYVLSPKDLCTISFFEKVMTSGAEAFKIEGRMRAPEYVSVVTSAYRTAIDSFGEEKLTEDLKEELLKKLEFSFNRGFSDGFYFGKPDDLGGTLDKEYEKVYLGEVIKYYRKIGVAEVHLTCGPLKEGQEILITGKSTPASFTKVEEMEIEHSRVDFVEKGSSAGIRVPFSVRPKDKVFLWTVKED